MSYPAEDEDVRFYLLVYHFLAIFNEQRKHVACVSSLKKGSMLAKGVVFFSSCIPASRGIMIGLFICCSDSCPIRQLVLYRNNQLHFKGREFAEYGWGK